MQSADRCIKQGKIRRNTEYGIISHTNTVYQWSGRNKVGKSTAAVQTAQLWYDGSKCSRHVIICLVIQMFLLSVVYNTAVIFFFSLPLCCNQFIDACAFTARNSGLDCLPLRNPPMPWNC